MHNFFDNPRLLTKRQKGTPSTPSPTHQVLTRKVKYRQYDEMVEGLMFEIEN